MLRLHCGYWKNTGKMSSKNKQSDLQVVQISIAEVKSRALRLFAPTWTEDCY